MTTMEFQFLIDAIQFACIFMLCVVLGSICWPGRRK